MLEEFQQIAVFQPSIFDIATNLVVAFICGLFISLVYRVIYSGPSYSSSFVNSLVLLCMITAVVILVIGNNLARAFGLVGAMSIIRFRTAVRDVQDIIFIFFSLSIGMAAGVGLTGVAIMATLIISLVFILLTTTGFSKSGRRKYLLQIAYAGSEANELELNRVLKKYCRKQQLVNLKNVGMEEELEAFYHISLRNKKKNAEFVRSLNQLKFVTTVNLFFEEEDDGSSTTTW